MTAPRTWHADLSAALAEEEVDTTNTQPTAADIRANLDREFRAGADYGRVLAERNDLRARVDALTAERDRLYAQHLADLAQVNTLLRTLDAVRP